MTGSALLIGIMLVPLIVTVGVIALHPHPNAREGLTVLGGLLLFGLVATLAAGIDFANPPTLLIAEPIPGLALQLTPEPLGILFALIASLLWPVTSVYAIGYMRGNREGHQTRFYAAFAVSIGAAMGIALAGNLLTLFLFYEVRSVAP